MAGKPRTRAVQVALERRTLEAMDEGATILDYAEEWVASGGTIAGLAKDLHRAELIPFEPSREAVRQAIYAVDPASAERRMRSARTRGADSIAEGALSAVQTVIPDRDHVAKARVEADFSLRLAGKWNKEDYGEAKGPTVNINLGSLHLDALRSPQQIPNPLFAPIEDAQVVAIEDIALLSASAGEARMPEEGA